MSNRDDSASYSPQVPEGFVIQDGIMVRSADVRSPEGPAPTVRLVCDRCGYYFQGWSAPPRLCPNDGATLRDDGPPPMVRLANAALLAERPPPEPSDEAVKWVCLQRGDWGPEGRATVKNWLRLAYAVDFPGRATNHE